MNIGPLALGLLGAAGALVALWLYACGRLVASVAADELKGWLPHIAAGIIATAVARLPETERARYDEEWLGELLAYQDRPVTALIFAIGVRRRVSEVANELPSPSAEPERLAESSLPDAQPWAWNEERFTWNEERWTWSEERFTWNENGGPGTRTTPIASIGPIGVRVVRWSHIVSSPGFSGRCVTTPG